MRVRSVTLTEAGLRSCRGPAFEIPQTRGCPTLCGFQRVGCPGPQLVCSSVTSSLVDSCLTWSHAQTASPSLRQRTRALHHLKLLSSAPVLRNRGEADLVPRNSGASPPAL